MTLRGNIPDLAFAAFLVALGAFAFALASDLTVGTAAAMGPGYVPRGLAGIIVVYGVVLGLRAAFTGRQAFPVIAWLLQMKFGLAVRHPRRDTRKAGAGARLPPPGSTVCRWAPRRPRSRCSPRPSAQSRASAATVSRRSEDSGARP